MTLPTESPSTARPMAPEPPAYQAPLVNLEPARPVQPVLRSATLADVHGLVELARQSAAEEALFNFAGDLARARLAHDLNAGRCIAAVIGDDPTTLEATIVLTLESEWYASAPQLAIALNFVAPHCRRGPHAKLLLEFAARTAEGLDLPLRATLPRSEIDTTAKPSGRRKLFQRFLGEPVGLRFAWRSPSTPDPKDTP